MNCKYFKHENTNEADTHVNFHYLDENNVSFKSETNSACFSTITYCTIPKKAYKIRVFKEANKIPYQYSVISRWIDEINGLGFPCKLISKESDLVVFFDVNIRDYVKKLHLSCTLQLIRALFEEGIYYVPEFYFEIIEKDPSYDKFMALQDAHKILTDKGINFFNSNHMITYKNGYGNGSNVTREELFRRINVSTNDTFSSDRPLQRLDHLWNAEKGISSYPLS